jgi:hypothetical protein
MATHEIVAIEGIMPHGITPNQNIKVVSHS